MLSLKKKKCIEGVKIRVVRLQLHFKEGKTLCLNYTQIYMYIHIFPNPNIFLWN